MINEWRIIVEKPQRRRQLERYRRRWNSSIEIGLKGIDYEAVDWI
jgi:hypothetical protein